jgi:hypothetical protein
MLSAATTILVVELAPALAAYECPRCYGLKGVGDGIYVDKAMPADELTQIKSILTEAERRVRMFYGAFDRKPVLLICATEACDRRLGGRGARARAYGSKFIFISPEGRNATILAHEYSHIEFHSRIGIVGLVLGAVPAWFDEGVAVIVSRDKRYLRIDERGKTHCLTEPVTDLPKSRREWGRRAGTKSEPIYAMAACRVLRWMESNGGSPGVLREISEMADGRSLRIGHSSR